MILNNVIFKRDDFLNVRVLKEVKKQFEVFVFVKGKSKSEFIFELVLKELEWEGIQIKLDFNNF